MGRSYLEGVIPINAKLLDSVIRAPLKFLSKNTKEEN
jgi:hypothetical protein